MSPLFMPFKVKAPSKSVIVPLLVPFITTDAPVTGPIVSFTVPLRTDVCCVISIALFSALR